MSHVTLEPDAVYRTLLESTRAIPWKIERATKTYAYVGPQIETLPGRTPASWVGAQDRVGNRAVVRF